MTISDIAEMAGVGLATVSRVLNNSAKVSAKTAKRVRSVLKETNYRPAHAARALARGKTNAIELLYNTGAARLSDDPVLLEILDAAYAELRDRKYRMLFSPLKSDFREIPDDLARTLGDRMADGAMLVSCRMTDKALEALCGQPIVLVDHHGNGMISSVSCDHYRAICEAVDMFAEQGHRNIAFIHSGTEDDNDTERYRAYAEQLQRRGLSRRTEWEMLFSDVRATLPGIMSQSCRPTALITGDASVLPAVLEVLAACGLHVPGDVSLLTVNATPHTDSDTNGLIRPVSGYCVHWDRVMRTAAEELFAVIRGDHVVRHIQLPVPFRDEGSIAPPPGHA